MDICRFIFIAAKFIVTRSWKQHIFLPTDECVEKMCYLQTMGYCASIKKDKFEEFIAKWMQSENIMLCQINQTYKVKYHVISLTRET